MREGESVEVRALIAAVAEGYPFPTNLDQRPPAPGGMAPESEQQLLVRALKGGLGSRISTGRTTRVATELKSMRIMNHEGCRGCEGTSVTVLAVTLPCGPAATLPTKSLDTNHVYIAHSPPPSPSSSLLSFRSSQYRLISTRSSVNPFYQVKRILTLLIGPSQ